MSFNLFFRWLLDIVGVVYVLLLGVLMVFEAGGEVPAENILIMSYMWWVGKI